MQDVRTHHEAESAGAELLMAAAANPEGAVYDDGYLRIEHQNYYVACDGQSIKLARGEFRLLSRLARCPERIVPADELWRHVWADNKPVNYQSLHVCIYRLRNKISPFGIEIETMIGVGYRLLPANKPTLTETVRINTDVTSD
jgi:DNA-binding response OmpR family regulator